jgi:hypothetical protein
MLRLEGFNSMTQPGHDLLACRIVPEPLRYSVPHRKIYMLNLTNMPDTLRKLERVK